MTSPITATILPSGAVNATGSAINPVDAECDGVASFDASVLYEAVILDFLLANTVPLGGGGGSGAITATITAGIEDD